MLDAGCRHPLSSIQRHTNPFAFRTTHSVNKQPNTTNKFHQRFHSGVRSMLVRVGPTGTEFGNRMPQERLGEILASWKYWGVLRHLHWMSADAVARAIVNAVEVPVEEAYPTVIEVQPGGRRREPGGA